MIEPEYVYEVKPVGSQENHTQDINNSLMFQGYLPDGNLVVSTVCYIQIL